MKNYTHLPRLVKDTIGFFETAVSNPGPTLDEAEYPFGNYNLFLYVYVLSFYKKAQGDPRFLDVLAHLEFKLVDGQMVVERVNAKLAKFSFCKKGEPSLLAMERYREMLKNIGRYYPASMSSRI